MISDTKYLTDKHVLRPIAISLLTMASGVALWILMPGKFQIGFWSGLVFVLLGVVMAVSNILSCCWYPVVLEEHVMLAHFLFRRMSRIIRYEDVLYARVSEFKVRQYDSSPVLTIMMKDGKKMNFTLMTRLEQIGQLSRELLDKGVSDAYEMPVSAVGKKIYCSKCAFAIFVVFIAAMVIGYVTAVVSLANPMIIVVTVIFVPLLVFLLSLLSYITIEDRRIMLKYMVFKSRDIDVCLDDVLDISIGGGSHFDVLLKVPDKKGISRHTRIVGLVSISMIQEINAWLKQNCHH